MCFDEWFFLKGLFVGFSVAAPIGPIAILCIRQNLAYGFLMGIICGLAVSLADGFYSLVAALGANVLNTLIHDHGKWFYFLGGALLIFIGRKVFVTEISEAQEHIKKKRHYVGAFFYTLFLTLASPMTTLLFIAMFTTAGVFKNTLGGANIIALVTGVFAGSMVWWTILSGAVMVIRKKLNFKVFLFINKVSGLAIIAFGIFTLTKIFS
jgi:threonine/homoserine/homoserine lactone efflux protein